MKRTIQLIELPTDSARFDVDLPTHVEFRTGYFEPRSQNLLLVRPGQKPQITLVPVCVMEFDPDAEFVPHRFVVCVSGSAIDAKHNELRYCTTLVHPEGKVFVLFEVVGHLGACVQCRAAPGTMHEDGCVMAPKSTLTAGTVEWEPCIGCGATADAHDVSCPVANPKPAAPPLQVVKTELPGSGEVPS